MQLQRVTSASFHHDLIKRAVFLPPQNAGKDAQWALVHLKGKFNDPVVILGVPSSSGPQEASPCFVFLVHHHL